MHMADALISPAVGGTFWAVSAGLIGCSSRKLRLEFSEQRIPLMGVAGAFVFAAQMINFTIPATGSSGHIGGGLLLAILLGPWAGFLVMASILVIQALFFADGGLLALGCNIFNLGFWTCFVAYPLVYKPLAGPSPNKRSIFRAAVIAAVVGLQFGSLSVVLQTVFAGITELPFTAFLLAMQPIHLAIGIVEGLVTAAVILFVMQARPELLTAAADPTHSRTGPVIAVLAAGALIAAGVLSWFASAHPDGLEWSISKTAGTEELDAPPEGIHTSLAGVQQKTAFLPDYSLKEPRSPGEDQSEEHRPAAAPSTGIAGLIGSVITCLVAVAVGLLLKFRFRYGPAAPGA